MKTAFTYWNKRISPVFDTARRIKIIESDSGRVVHESLETMESDLPVQKTFRLTELGVDILVCGAVSKSLHEMLSAHGIRVISFVAGDLQEVIQAWLNGDLEQQVAFTMPGCTRRAA